MGANVYQLADDLTGGEFSKVKEAKESLERANAAQEGTIKSQEGTIKSQEETIKSQEGTIKSREETIKSREETIKSQAQEIEDLKTAKAVLAMHARNMSPEEIALKLDLRLSEVHRILEDVGEDA